MEYPKYKLIYFNLRGFGECIKYIFAYKGIQYDLQTIPIFSREANWEELKWTLPFGQLPLLEVDGKKLSQSLAICQFLANKHNLLYKKVWEDSQLVAIGCSLQDIILRVARYYYEKDLEQRIQLKTQFLNKLLPFYLQRYNDLLKEHDNFFFGKLTWLDFYMVSGLEFINNMMEEDWISDKYPALEALIRRIHRLPGVKKYVESRPFYNR